MSRLYLRNQLWHARESVQTAWLRLESRLKPWTCRRRLRGHDGRLDVHVHAKVGFFAQMNWVLMILAHCEAYGLRPGVALTSPFYADLPGENWFSHFFAWREPGPVYVESRACHIRDLQELGLPKAYEASMTLERANSLWHRYVCLKPEIEAYVEAFSTRHFAGREVLGVHFRGTDKSTEAPRVSWSAFDRSLEKALLNRTELNALFVSSDEPAFIEHIERKFAGMPVIAHEDQLSNREGVALHVLSEPGRNRRKAQDALVNALLLSRCAALVRSASFLSGWASVFNPALPVALLNRPYDDTLWFPDREIVKQGNIR